MKVSVFLFLANLLVATTFAAQPTKPNWPSDFKLKDNRTLTVFQPQVEAMNETKVQARAAFKISEGKKETFGSFTMAAKAQVSKDEGIVTLEDIQVSDIQAPTAKIDKKSFSEEIEKNLNTKLQPIPYKTLLDNLNANNVDTSKHVQVKNDPPAFVFSTKPSMLIMISGDPKWVDVKEAKGVERIINTSALIMHEKDKDYYLWALRKWFTAKQLMGPYQATKKEPSSKFVMTKDQLIKDKKVDPLEGRTQSGAEIYPPGVNPEIIIATKPTELLQSNGTPKYDSVAGTSLLYMSNSANSIFMDSQTQKYFILTSGRWFTSKSLSGPWDYVSGKELPKDFAKIPVTSPVAEVLVSVPGTPQAKEAVIATSIPQTAKVARSLKPEKIECDGGKFVWVAITGTNLKYAESCNTPLLQVSSDLYYVVQNGVWFSAQKPEGPWQVAIVVPDEIYKIPTSSPLYYITYVHIYGSTDTEVTVGYMPGYHGTFTSADGTVVYGTGYAYNSYTSGSTWYPAPSTYGFGVGYGWGYNEGFYMGFTMGAFMYPWGWGTCCWGPTYVNIDITNTYTKWGKHTVVSGPGGGGFTVNTIGQHKFARGNDSSNIYTRHDGEVYRRLPGGEWQKYNGPNTWADVDSKINKSDLDKMHNSRTAANQLPNRQDIHADRGGMDRGSMDRGGMQQPQQRPSSPPPALRGGGGGFRGGGGGGFRR